MLNQQLKELMEYYFNDAPVGEYAMLVKGSWGSGKTHFVKEFLKRYGRKHFYISLNGIRTVDAINNAILAEAYPVLHGEKMKLAKKVLKGVFAASLRMNVFDSDDGNAEIQLNAQFKFEDFYDGPNGTGSAIVVLDDFERCSVECSELLGFVCNLVEEAKCKVIVLADTNQLSDKTIFDERKERVFGTELTLKPDYCQAITTFISDIENVRLRKFLEAKQSDVVELLQSSGVHNLRHLKYAIFQFERLVNNLNKEEFLDERVGNQILFLLIAFTIEQRAGSITCLTDLKNAIFPSTFSRSENVPLEEKPSLSFSVKYPQIRFFDTIVAPELWAIFVFDGLIDSESWKSAIEIALGRNETNWAKVWDLWDLDLQTFDKAVEGLQHDIEKLNFEHPYEIIHAVCLMRFLCEETILGEKFDILDIEANVLNKLPNYIVDLEPEVVERASSERSPDNFAGKAFYNRDKECVRRFIKKFQKILQKQHKKVYENLVDSLPSVLEQGTVEFAHISGQISKKIRMLDDFYFFKLLDKERTADALFKASSLNFNIRSVGNFFKDVFQECKHQNRIFDDEQEALTSFIEHLELRLDGDTPIICKIKLGNLINQLRGLLTSPVD